MIAARCAEPIDTADAPQRTTSASDAAIVVPLCAVVENPAQYDGKRVTITGCITTDGYHYVVLKNLEHPCSGGGIVPVHALALPPEQRFEPGADKKVCGTFTGTFLASNPLYKRVLEVEKTSGLKESPYSWSDPPAYPYVRPRGHSTTPQTR